MHTLSNSFQFILLFQTKGPYYMGYIIIITEKYNKIYTVKQEITK